MTSFVCRPGWPQKSHAGALAFDIDRDDDSAAGRAELRHCAACGTGEVLPANDDLQLAGCAVALAFNDAAGEDDALKVKDRQPVVFKLVGSVERHHVLPGSDELPQERDAERWHDP